jgi:putative flavoprotein involved in K+ transport
VRLVRLGPAGAERPAVLISDDRAVDVGDFVGDFGPTFLAEGGVERLESVFSRERVRLPVRLVNRAGRAVTKLIPDLTAYGLPRPDTGLYTRVLEGAIPVQDAGLVRAVRRRQVQPVGAVEAFAGDTVRLAGGEEISPEVVITATGYRRGLEPLVGHLGLLDSRGLPTVHGQNTHPAASGLYFTGYTNPISGMLRELSRDAPRIAAAIARER